MKIPILYNIELFIRKKRNNIRSKLLKKFCNLKEYDFIFSLGEACFCTSMLRDFNLRKHSCPFDWLLGSNFKSRIDILHNEFEDWLNIEDLEYVSQRFEPEPCDIYYNKRNKITFNHDFKINTPLDKSFPKVKEKYNRRINRLLNILSDKEKDILIIYMEYEDIKTASKTNTEIIEAVEKLNKRFKANINMLYFAHDINMEDKEYNYKELNSRVTKITLFNNERDEDAHWVGNTKNLKLILPKLVGLK